MAKQITRWTPDTCDCVIDLEWDDEVPAEERVHTVSKVVKKPEHFKSATDKQIFETVLAENQSKNRVIGQLKKELVLSDEEEVKWSLDEERKLHVEIPEGKSLTATKRNKVLGVSDIEVIFEDSLAK